MTPEDAKLHIALSNGRAAKDITSRSIVLTRIRLARTIEVVEEHLPGFRSGSLLDAGGTSPFYVRALDHDGLVVNIDPVAVAAVTAAGCRAVVADLKSLDVPDAHFENALCLEVVEHVTDPIGVLRELRRVVRNAAVVSVPYVDQTRVRATARDVRTDHVFEFSGGDFDSIAAHAGWNVARREPLLPFRAMPKWWIALLR